MLLLIIVVTLLASSCQRAEVPGEREVAPALLTHISIDARVVDGAVRLTVVSDSAAATAVSIERDFIKDPGQDPPPDAGALRGRDYTAVAEVRVAAADTAVVVDAAVLPGGTYMYWVSAGERESSPTFVRVPRGVWGKRRVDEWIETLASDPRARVRVHGRTVQGWPLRSVSVGNPDRTLALIGGIHASEGGPEILAPVFERFMSEDAELLQRVGVSILPLVNGDERERIAAGYPWYLRKNTSGVDLNRNFDASWEQEDKLYGASSADPGSPTYRGPYAASEPETAAMVDFLRTVRPLAVASLHGPGTLFILPADAEPEYASRVIALAMAYHRGCAGGRPVGKFDMAVRSGPGTLAQWVYQYTGVPAFDVECNKSEACVALVQNRATEEQMRELIASQYGGIRGALLSLAE